MSRYFPCPCGSKQLYQKCCQRFHNGIELPATAEALMRSRYSAYSLGLTDYVITTTHHSNKHFSTDLEKWRAEVQKFCDHTKFCGLEVVATEGDDEKAYVTFKASLRQLDTDVSFEEKSEFLKEDGRWLYARGQIKD